jgi:hypothetical protein
VKINLDDPDQSKFPLGAQGSAAIYTGGEHGACLRALTSQCRGFGFSQVQVRASQQKVACFS